MKALVLAGGRGKRLEEPGHNKCMLRLFEKPLIEYSLENAISAGVCEIVIVVGYRAEEIINRFGNQFRNTPIKYVIQKQAKGVVHAIECAQPMVESSDFILFLADEILRNPRHEQMIREFYSENAFVMCGVVEDQNPSEIRKTYAIIQDKKNRIIYRLIEKPRNPPNSIRGTGNCIFHRQIFDYFEYTPINPVRGEKELPDLIQCAIDDGHLVKSFDIGTDYININAPEDIDRAESAYRTRLEWSDVPESLLPADD